MKREDGTIKTGILSILVVIGFITSACEGEEDLAGSLADGIDLSEFVCDGDVVQVCSVDGDEGSVVIADESNLEDLLSENDKNYPLSCSEDVEEGDSCDADGKEELASDSEEEDDEDDSSDDDDDDSSDD